MGKQLPLGWKLKEGRNRSRSPAAKWFSESHTAPPRSQIILRPSSTNSGEEEKRKSGRRSVSRCAFCVAAVHWLPLAPRRSALRGLLLSIRSNSAKLYPIRSFHRCHAFLCAFHTPGTCCRNYSHRIILDDHGLLKKSPVDSEARLDGNMLCDSNQCPRPLSDDPALLLSDCPAPASDVKTHGPANVPSC